MTNHPYHDVAIAGVYNTRQARVLQDADSTTVTMEDGMLMELDLNPVIVGPSGAVAVDYLVVSRAIDDIVEIPRSETLWR
jgi:hypothetical protein